MFRDRIQSRDIYETEDLPEADQDYEEEIKDCVETIKIPVVMAYSKFKGKELVIQKSKTDAQPLSVSSLSERGKKILDELELLGKQLGSSENYETSSTEPVSKEQLQMLVEALRKQVIELNIDKTFGPDSKFEIKCQDNIIYQKLCRTISDHHVSAQKSVSERPTSKTYILKRHTDLNQNLNQSKIANLTKRLEILEKLIGTDSVKLSSIVTECPNRGMLEAVERLTAKTALLNNPQINIIESRLDGVIAKLQNLSTVASNSNNLDSESQAKISELYELVKKLDPVADTIPNIIDHLTSMQDAHLQSAKLSQCLQFLDIKEHELYFKQQTNQMALKNMQENLPLNFERMVANMKNIENRIKALN